MGVEGRGFGCRGQGFGLKDFLKRKTYKNIYKVHKRASHTQGVELRAFDENGNVDINLTRKYN